VFLILYTKSYKYFIYGYIKKYNIELIGGFIMKDIAVEKGLSTISDYLKKNGYKVYEIDASQKSNRDFTNGFDAVVLSGMDSDLLGIKTTSTKAPVIIASGLRPEDIMARIETAKM
jgi:hypothetical protein